MYFLVADPMHSFITNQISLFKQLDQDIKSSRQKYETDRRFWRFQSGITRDRFCLFYIISHRSQVTFFVLDFSH